MTYSNSTFGRGVPVWATACVGNNGFPSYWEYAKGFSQAANLLLGNVLDGAGSKYSVDEFVYPICFNMRHSVELRLKGAISELEELEKKRGRKLEFDYAGSHDIGNIWQFFSEQSILVDDRYTPFLSQLDRKIRDIAEIDATGQTFRYPLDTESQKHLVDVANISLVRLKESFSYLESVLDELHHLNHFLHDEYWVGSFTKKLSRKNIFEIASKLPDRSKWRDESFDAIKKELKEQFNVGSKELSSSINIIQTHYEFAPIIGMSVELLGVTDEDIFEFIEHWFKMHELQPDFQPVDLSLSDEREMEDVFQSISQMSEIRKQVWEEVHQKLTPELLAGLSALFYFAREMDFSENYMRIYERSLREAEAVFGRSEEAIWDQYFHIYDKTSAVNNMLKSLFFVKKDNLAEELVSNYNLESKFSWLNKARDSSLFTKPEFCGYRLLTGT